MRTVEAIASVSAEFELDPLPELDSKTIFNTQPDGSLQDFAEDAERMARRVITLLWAYQKIWPDHASPQGSDKHVLEFADIVTELIGHYMNEQVHAAIRARAL